MQTVIEMAPGGDVRRFTLRLLGIDTPEIRGKCPETKRRAVAARDKLASLVTREPAERFEGMTRFALRTYLDEHPAVVELHCGGFGKYGRALVEVYDAPEVGQHQTGGGERVSFSQTLLSEGFASAYD